jgi:hypothetical protein
LSIKSLRDALCATNKIISSEIEKFEQWEAETSVVLYETIEQLRAERVIIWWIIKNLDLEE